MNMIKITDPVQSVVSALAGACLQKTLDQGGTIEIPSLGIKIRSAMSKEQDAKEVTIKEEKRRYRFTGWNIAMAAVHSLPHIDEIFPKPETLKPEDLCPNCLLMRRKIKL